MVKAKKQTTAKKTAGKSVRISDAGWEKIRKHCQKNSLVMGAFIEKTALKEINQ